MPRSVLVHCILMIVLLSEASALRAQSDNPMTAADVERQVEELSNWGRWGDDDQLGALNLITPEKRRDAMKLVKDGISISLARQVEKDAGPDNPAPFEHEMLQTGLKGDGMWSMDSYKVQYHGFAHTHMDALCHLFHNGRMYNGFPITEVGPQGAGKLSIQHVRDGIITRGILIDIPRLKGVRFLEPGTPVYPEDLDAWVKRANVTVRSGDVVFIRTGRWARRDLVGPWDAMTEGLAGLHGSCAKWLKQRDIAMLGSDAAADVMPSGIEGSAVPVHLLMLHAMGVPLFDNCDLEAVAKQADQLERWEFLLTASPLVVEGGTGSPLNPIATF